MKGKIIKYNMSELINDNNPQIKITTNTKPLHDDKWDGFAYGIGGPTVWSENYTIFTKAERDFIKILDLGYIVRTPNNEALYIKVEGSRDINIDLYKINIAQDFGLKFNSLEINRRYSIAELKEMMNELS